MAFFTKQEIMQRMTEKRADLGKGARADVNLALIILGSALFEKRLWSGRDYGEHPLTVGLTNTRSIAKIIIGLLHDVVEDSDWTVDDLRAVGFSERVANGVDAMTRRGGELYFDFIERCSLDAYAADKKIDDLKHNSDVSRTEILLGSKDMFRLNKYVVSLSYLLSVKKGIIPRGTSFVDFIASRDDYKNSATVHQLLAANSSHVAANPAAQPAPSPQTGDRPALAP